MKCRLILVSHVKLAGLVAEKINGSFALIILCNLV